VKRNATASSSSYQPFTGQNHCQSITNESLNFLGHDDRYHSLDYLCLRGGQEAVRLDWRRLLGQESEPLAAAGASSKLVFAAEPTQNPGLLPENIIP
jgi:hypothetical protein